MKLIQRIIVCVLVVYILIVLNGLYQSNKKNENKLNMNTVKRIVNKVSSLPEKVRNSVTVNEKEIYKRFNVTLNKEEKQFVNEEMSRLQIDLGAAARNSDDLPNLWKIAASWVTKDQIYPKNHPEMSSILYAMSTAKITKADVLPKGTQLKLLLEIEGGQKIVFKQKRYPRDYVIVGKPYDGFDRHNAEIASFHLDRVMNFRRSPLVVGRVINLRTEIKPVASEKLLKTFLEKDGNICYYGVCYYCKPEEKACADGDMMEGSVTLWLPDDWAKFEKLRHPYQRTYVDSRKAKWETDEDYCNTNVKTKPPYDAGPRLLDITDATVFDYLIGNADRHHYEVFKEKGPNVMLLMMDNAKSFGNNLVHEQSILAPLRQCCILRNETYQKIWRLRGGILTDLLDYAMENDPIAPVLDKKHYKAMNYRLPHIFNEIEKCILKHGYENVILNEWKGLKT